MSFNGTGTFLINSAGQPVVAGAFIISTAFNALTADLASGLSNCITRDGQGLPTATIPWNSQSLTGVNTLGAVTATISGNSTIGGTLGVVGASTFTGIVSVATGASYRINNRLLASSDGSTQNSFFSGGTGGVLFRNAADTVTIGSLTNTGVFDALSSINLAGVSIFISQTHSNITLTGVPVAPTAAAKTANTQIATTAFVDGLRSLLTSATSGTLVLSDRGTLVSISAGLTVPNSVFAANDVVTIYNNSAGALTITAGITTLRLSGTATTGNRTLAQRGIATIVFISGTEAVISGAVT